MEVNFYPAFEECYIEDCENMKGTDIKKFISDKLEAKDVDLYVLYQGYVIGDDDTPSKYGAQSGDTLMCYVKIHARQYIMMNFNSTSGATFRPNAPFAAKKSSVPTFASRSSPVAPPRQETDLEYAKRMINKGEYTHALRSVKYNGKLKHLLIDEIKKRDSHLYDILKSNPAILDSFVANSDSLPSLSENSGSTVVLLTDADNNNLATLVDMMNIDLETATERYLACNKNLETCVNRYFDFWTVCFILFPSLYDGR